MELEGYRMVSAGLEGGMISSESSRPSASAAANSSGMREAAQLACDSIDGSESKAATAEGVGEEIGASIYSEIQAVAQQARRIAVTGAASFIWH